MANSNKRAYMRRERQRSRAMALTKEQMREHPEAARIFVIFGHPWEECLREASRPRTASRRAIRQAISQERDMIRRQAQKQQWVEHQRQWAKEKAAKETAKKERQDTRGGLRSFMPKKSGG